MVKYIKPEIEVIRFATEAITNTELIPSAGGTETWPDED